LSNDRSQQPVRPEHYDETYFLSACEGYEEFTSSEGTHLSRRLSQSFAIAQVVPGMRVLDVGCGRGEILRRCAELNVEAHGIDYAPVATHIALSAGTVYQANARHLPFPDAVFDRVLMFDLVEHLHQWELDRALAEARRVLRHDGKLIIHTAPNAWYDRRAYPVVRMARKIMGHSDGYPKNPRAIISANLDVHVNEQSALSLWRVLRRAGFRARIWLDTPPQKRDEGMVLAMARHVLFNWPPFSWFFEREVFAVAKPV
jgi:SAM-dependent methyltransferase